jgi:hypothetical protein
VSMRQVMAFARIYPGLRCRIELGCFFGHWDSVSILAHRLRDSLENRQASSVNLPARGPAHVAKILPPRFTFESSRLSLDRSCPEPRMCVLRPLQQPKQGVLLHRHVFIGSFAV